MLMEINWTIAIAVVIAVLVIYFFMKSGKEGLMPEVDRVRQVAEYVYKKGLSLAEFREVVGAPDFPALMYARLMAAVKAPGGLTNSIVRDIVLAPI